MARTTSDEEVQLKKRARRRLVGAVVLATTVAVVLPMVLDTEPRPVSHNVNIQIPSPDAPGFAPKPEPARQDGDAKPAPSSAQESAEPAKPESPAVQAAKPEAAVEKKESAPAVAQAPAAPEAPAAQPAKAPEPSPTAAKEASKPEAKEAHKPSVKEAPKAAAKEAPKATASGKFVVQVAALADTAKAKQLQQQMSAAGVRAYTEVVKTAKGNVTRVRAGPYDTREAAEKARGRLKGAGLDGKVVPR